MNPILVVGMNRSGTKWISNILSNHPQVSSAQYQRGHGIQETNLFGAFPRAFGDLAAPDNYVGLVEWWARTDFFRILDIEREYLYRLDPRPRTQFGLFRRLMEEAARRRGARYWLQKTSPFWAAACREHYPDARWVVIERDLVATLRSTLRLQSAQLPSRAAQIRAVFSFVHQEKLLRRVKQQPGAAALTYEALRADPGGETQRICAALGLDYDAAMLALPFQPNTSFRTTREREETLTPAMERELRHWRRGLRLLPLSACRWARRRWGREDPGLVPGTHGLIKDEHGLG